MSALDGRPSWFDVFQRRLAAHRRRVVQSVGLFVRMQRVGLFVRMQRVDLLVRMQHMPIKTDLIVLGGEDLRDERQPLGRALRIEPPRRLQSPREFAAPH